MAGGQITYEFGFCPMNKAPLCCAVVVSPTSNAWNVICTYVAAKRPRRASIPVVTFPLKFISRKSGSDGMRRDAVG